MVVAVVVGAVVVAVVIVIVAVIVAVAAAAVVAAVAELKSSKGSSWAQRAVVCWPGGVASFVHWRMVAWFGS